MSDQGDPREGIPTSNEVKRTPDPGFEFERDPRDVPDVGGEPEPDDGVEP
ncbi:MAG TPA: hypothetical protein VGB14_01010 [Acidimicrobiales bacterium]|jgi:hypothetical protein